MSLIYHSIGSKNYYLDQLLILNHVQFYLLANMFSDFELLLWKNSKCTVIRKISHNFFAQKMCTKPPHKHPKNNITSQLLVCFFIWKWWRMSHVSSYSQIGQTLIEWAFPKRNGWETYSSGLIPPTCYILQSHLSFVGNTTLAIADQNSFLLARWTIAPPQVHHNSRPIHVFWFSGESDDLRRN